MNKQNYDIIYLSLFRWNGPYSSISIALAKEFAKARRVFYINHPFTLKDVYSKDPQFDMVFPTLNKSKTTFQETPENPNLIAITPPTTLPINFLSPGWMYQKMATRNHQIIYKTIRETIKKYQIRNYVYLNCFDPFYAPVLPDSFHPIANVYQCVDDISQESYIAKHGIEGEKKAIQHADLTLVTSQELYSLKSPYSSNIHILNNAADHQNFNRAVTDELPKPTDIAHLTGDLIGYIGNLDGDRIDYPLIKAIATHHPKKQLVIVGPINSDTYKTIGLDQMANVHFLGGKHITELPAYLQHFSTCIIPFLKNTLTKSIYPLKINEYLAAGKSVISTDFSPDIASFKDFIYLANTHTDFINAIDKAIADNAPEQIQARLTKAATNTWTARMEQFESLVEPFLQKNKEMAL